jgi:menaquinone-specific isochorismate synthase
VKLHVSTTRIDDIAPFLAHIDPRDPLLFIRRGDGIAGIGEAVRLEFSGPERMREAAEAWRRLAAEANVDDEVALAGSGLVGFGSFAFSDDSSAVSVLIVPKIILGRRDGVDWLTRVDGADFGERFSLGDEVHLQLDEPSFSADEYAASVERAVEAIGRGEVSKVVLARPLDAELPEGADLRRIARDLAFAYPDTYTFAVDGLIGSSPETLIRSEKGELSARVLAGSAGRGTDAASDAAAALALATSQKDLDEHAFALRSLLMSLDGYASRILTGESPFTLKLPNLWHLASDVTGQLAGDSSSLDLIDALHPTAAVAGTPTADALRLIAALEPFDRGRYAGPVGWVGADGDGEWAIALRCAQVVRAPAGETATIRAFAGAGIVAESEAGREVAETTMKFMPIADALG